MVFTHYPPPPPHPTDPERPVPVLSMSHDWVPILDKVFGQKWCSDIWQVKELEVVRGKSPGEGGGGGGPRSVPSPFDLVPVDMEPSPTLPQQDPRWTPLEDMEVLSPDDHRTGKPHERAVSPAGELHANGSRCSPCAPTRVIDATQSHAVSRSCARTLFVY